MSPFWVISQFQDPLKVGDGLLDLSHPLVRKPPVVIGIGVLCVEFDGLAIVCQRLPVLAHTVVGDPTDVVGTGMRGVEFDGHAIVCQCLLVLAHETVGVPPVGVDSRVLWGEDTRSLFRDFDQKDIPLGEGVRFVCNQLTTLVRMWRKSDIEPMLYFLYRTWTSFGTALLLAVRKLEPTYRDRSVRLAETFRQDYPELAADLPHFPEQLTRATEFKIAPQFRGDTSLDEVNALWRCTRDAAWKVLETYLNRWLGRAPLTDNLRRLSGHYYRDYIRQPFPLNVALDLAARLFMNWRYYRRTQRECGRGYFRWTWRSVDIQLWSVLPAVLDGLPGGKFTPETLAQIPYPALGLSPCWKEVRERYVRAFDGAKVLREPPSALGFLFGK